MPCWWTAEALNWLIAIFLKYMSPVAYVLTGNAPGTTSTELMVYRCSLTLQLMSYGGVRFVMGVAPVMDFPWNQPSSYLDSQW